MPTEEIRFNNTSIKITDWSFLESQKDNEWLLDKLAIKPADKTFFESLAVGDFFTLERDKKNYFACLEAKNPETMDLHFKLIQPKPSTTS